MSQFDIFAATEFDAFETLKAERRAEIYNKGVKFSIQHSEKTITAIYQDQAKTLIVSDQTNIHPGLILNNSKSGQLLILHIQKFHGYSKAHFAEISGTLQTYHCNKAGTFQPGASIITIKNPNGSSSLCVPATQCPRTGSVIKYGSVLHTVTGTASVATGIVELHLDIIAAPSLPQAKRHENKPTDPVSIEQRQFEVMQWRN